MWEVKVHLVVGLIADDNRAVPEEECGKHQTEDEIGPEGEEGDEGSW